MAINKPREGGSEDNEKGSEKQGGLLKSMEGLINVVSTIQQVTGKPIASISSKDLTRIPFEGKEVSIANLFLRIAKVHFHSNNKAAAKRLLIGIFETKELLKTKEEIAKHYLETQAESAPLPIQFITGDTLNRVQTILGHPITEFRINQVEGYSINIEGENYFFSVRSLLRRVMNAGESITVKKARNFLNLLALGNDIFTAEKIVGIKVSEHWSELTNRISVAAEPENVLSEVAEALSRQLSVPLTMLTTKSDVHVKIELSNLKFEGKLRSLLDGIGVRIGATRGRVLEKLKNLCTGSQESFVQNSKLDKQFLDLVVTSDGVRQLESVGNIQIATHSTKDVREITLTINGVSRTFKYRQFLETVAGNYLGDKAKRGIARVFLSLVKDGVSIDDASLLASSSDDVVDNIIEKFDLTEAIALLGASPSKLKLYLKIAHPELSERDSDTIVGTSFKRLSTRKSFDYSTFEPGLGPITFESRSFAETSEAVYLITGNAPGADSVMVSGHREIRVRTNPDGSFRVRVPLSIGELNEIMLVPINHTDKKVGPEISISVQQTSEPDDIEALIRLLDAMGKAALNDIRQDPGRFNYVVQQTEQVLIRKFSKNFEEGRNYIEGLIATTKSPAVKKVLKKVLDNFRRIDRTTYPNVKQDSPLYFFQKYCVAEIQRRIAKGDAGVILANAPGLGKTRTALVAINGDPATIIAPNSVVSAWGEEAEKCLKDSNVLTLRNLHSKKRIEKLQKNNGTHVVTNVEFLRAHPDDPRYALLANEETIIVQDEAHGLANLASEQSKGARRLNGKFQLLLSATPFKDPKMMRRMFHHLYPHDVRFSSDKAFSKAFPANDHEALRTLSILKDQFVIRFRKEDVLEEMDPKIPVEDQKHRLPKKEHIPPAQHGTFTMTMKQAEATYELFKDWGKWTKKYDKYVPKDEIAKMDGLRGNEFTFGKLHALRQIANNPAYVGEKGVEDPKAAQMKRAVEKCLKEGRKVVIFCQYNAQAQKYAELLKKYAPSLYTGVTSKEGNKKDVSGKEMLFQKHEKGGWVIDSKGYPVPDPEGTPMLAMDYERITYQSTQDRKVMIATYSAGAVGVTFTAGKAVIFDDLPRDCTEEIQAEDRTHRIDHEHQTHHTVQYMKMASAYPKAFLERMKKTWVKKKDDGTYEETINSTFARKHGYETAYKEFFEQGTWDQVKIGNLKAQRNMFDLLNDGIIDKAEATKDVQPFSVDLSS